MHSLHSSSLCSPDPVYWQFLLQPGHSGDRGNRGGGDQHHPRPGEGKGEAGGGDTIENSGSGGESLYPLTVKLWFYFQVSFLNSYSIEYWPISLIDNRPNYYPILTFLIWFLICFLPRYLIQFLIRFLIRFLILSYSVSYSISSLNSSLNSYLNASWNTLSDIEPTQCVDLDEINLK